MTTKVEVKCIKKTEVMHHNGGIQTQVELEVPYDQNNIYFKLSGGTNAMLCTINQEAADMFTIGEKYNINISPVEKEEILPTSTESDNSLMVSQ